MTLTLLEGAIDTLSTYVQVNMAAKVATLNSRYGDSLLVEPVKYYLGNLPLSMPESPSVVFHGDDWTALDQRAVNVQAACGITIFVFVGDDNVENRFRKLCRYTLGLTELLRPSLSALAYRVRIRGPAALTEPMNTQPFLQGMALPITLENIETY